MLRTTLGLFLAEPRLLCWLRRLDFVDRIDCRLLAMRDVLSSKLMLRRLLL